MFGLAINSEVPCLALEGRSALVTRLSSHKAHMRSPNPSSGCTRWACSSSPALNAVHKQPSRTPPRPAKYGEIIIVLLFRVRPPATSPDHADESCVGFDRPHLRVLPGQVATALVPSNAP